MYRHGDRSPASSYPTSTVDPSFWPNGFGQLTIRGEIQQIRLGQYLRERYSQLLNFTYVASEVREKK
jgi:lysosomal acid phosphatase